MTFKVLKYYQKEKILAFRTFGFYLKRLFSKKLTNTPWSKCNSDIAHLLRTTEL